jgi:PAS domain S-box-containing protein
MESENNLRILHLEDDPSDSLLVQSVLTRANIRYEYFFADNEKDYCNFLKKQSIDLILSDYHLPDYSGREALAYAKEFHPQIPFIFLSGAMGEDAAIESLLNGATDYVLKNKLERLVPAVLRSANELREMKARMLAENELRKISRAVEQSPNSVIITDIDGTIEYINDSGLKLTGYNLEELIKQNPRIFSSGLTTKEEYETLWGIITSGGDWKGEFRNKKKNGEIYWEAVTISPILDNSGKITHFVGIKEDITERKKLTLDLIKAKEKAEESDRLKTSFLHNISHEIRTPLNSIIGFSGFLTDPELPSEKRKYFSDIIIQSSNQLLSIISDIVSIATIEAGQAVISENIINLNSVLIFLQDHFAGKAKMKNITLNKQFFLEGNECTVITEEGKLVQILSNLIGNAIKFTKEGSVTFGCIRKDKELEFFVEDTGIGIATDMHDLIFERFRQVESTTTRQFGGSGLGLSISKAYVELLGGKIWLRSELKKGSCFYFTIPYKRSEIDSVVGVSTDNDTRIDSGVLTTILVAEDEDSNFILLAEYLSDLNVKIIRAINGFDAVEICKSNNSIDLVLMDIKMPIMDGYEATRQIREFNKDIPVIAQTAYYSDIDKKRAMECGCTDFISKPIKQEILIAKIEALMR